MRAQLSEAIKQLAMMTLRAIHAIALLVGLFAVAVVYACARIIQALAPILLRGACVAVFVWTIVNVAHTGQAAYAARSIAAGALAVAVIIGAIITLGAALADALGANRVRETVWGLLLFCAAVAWLTSELIQTIDANLLAALPLAIAFAVNPIFLMKEDTMKNRTEGALKMVAIALAALTYAGAVVYGDIQFLQVMDKAFPGDGLMRALAMAGAVMTAISALTLPIALHWWFAPGLQFLWGIAFWVLDIAALGLNAILAYQVASGHVDAGLGVWQTLSPATPLLAVIGWGIAFLLDPSQKERHAVAEMQADQIDVYAEQMRQAANSDEVYQEILTAAKMHAREFAQSLRGQRTSTSTPQTFSMNASATVQNADDVRPTKRAPKHQASSGDREPVAVKPSRNGHGEASPLA